MVGDPRRYPRIAHLPPGVGATRDDQVLTPEQAGPFFSELVTVEEKLDGASATLWLDGSGIVRAGTRGGSGAVDRAGQLGPLRAWVSERSDDLRPLLAEGAVLYGEWLWLAHGLRYDRLPDWLIGLDLWDPGAGFAALDERNRRLTEAGVALPPEVSLEVLGSEGRVAELLRTSAFGDTPAEGLIVRRFDPQPSAHRLAKALSPAFVRRSDEAWRTPSRNALAA